MQWQTSGGSRIWCGERSEEEVVKRTVKFGAVGVLAVLGVGLMVNGCSFTPDLNKTAAMSMIQASYDQRPTQPAIIAVDSMGLKQGLSANLWKLTKVYPNQRWADYTLTDTGKKAFKLQNGGEVIEWRPDQGSSDFHFFITTIASNHLKAKELQDPKDDVVPGVDTGKSALFTEVYDWTGVPDPVQNIAHNAINKLSNKRTAEFALVSGNWTLHEIK